MKLIEGVRASPGDPEFGISRGCLMPQHRILDTTDVSAETRSRLQDSLVLVHGGMAQNVGPILEMVTEKYLLRSEAEWKGRQEAMRILDEILGRLRAGDVAGVGAATERNFAGPIQTIIPWASNLYTETLIRRARAEMGADFWGFWMLGGMSGGGMGFIFEPSAKAKARERLQEYHARDQAPAGAGGSVCDGAGGLRFRHQRARHVCGFARGQLRAHAARLLHVDRSGAVAAGDPLAFDSPARRARPLWRRLPHRA